MSDEQQAPTQSEDTLEAAQQRASEFEAKWKRALADYQNREKDIARERAEFVQFSTAGIIRDLLPIIDALHAAAIIDAHLENLVKLCADFLKKQGVEPVGKVGDRADYLIHEVVGTRLSSEALLAPRSSGEVGAKEGAEGGREAEMILDVVQTGYTMGGRLLRPAKVIISAEEE